MNNFVKRTITSVVFVAVMLAATLQHYVFGGVFLLIMMVAMQEFYSITLGAKFLAARRFAIFTAASSFILLYAHFQYGLSLTYLSLELVLLMLIGCIMVWKYNIDDIKDYALVYVPLITIALPILLTTRIVHIHSGLDSSLVTSAFDGKVLLSIFAIIWLSDAGAYIVGSALGQKSGSRKLSPSISPKKSWCGFWGGLISALLIALALHFTGILNIGLVHSLILALLVSLASVMGDLQESMWKRCFNIKDSGNCIPGHGGMYDRFDSTFVAIPVAFVYLIMMNLI